MELSSALKRCSVVLQRMDMTPYMSRTETVENQHQQQKSRVFETMEIEIAGTSQRPISTQAVSSRTNRTETPKNRQQQHPRIDDTVEVEIAGANSQRSISSK